MVLKMEAMGIPRNICFQELRLRNGGHLRREILSSGMELLGIGALITLFQENVMGFI